MIVLLQYDIHIWHGLVLIINVKQAWGENVI